MHGAGDNDANAVPASGLAGLGDGAAGPGQHMPHGPIPTQAGSGREPLPALQPRRCYSHGRQCLELPVACCASGGSLWSDWLDWLPVCWTHFKHVHMVITNGHGQKVPFEGGMCLVKLLLIWRGSYFRIWNKKLTSWSSTTSWKEACNSSQTVGQQEASARTGVDPEMPSPRRHLCLIKQVHL